MSKYDEAQRLLDSARDAFVRAASLLDPRVRFEQDALAAAVIEGALGLYRLSQADFDNRAFDRAIEHLPTMVIRKAGGK